MIAVAPWLAELGLAEHAATFATNGVGADVLRELTDADLKELGLNLGDRRRLLRAIAALKAPAAPAQHRRSEAERRQLTVMFVDLVGSTALSARLDPEDMREVIRAYQDAVTQEIGRLEGHVAKFMGDGVLAYFGWPRAHEDEAERAVRAGLAIVAAVGRLTGGGEALACRVGIATGLVVVGDLVGQGAAQEQAVVGDTPNLAARLQGAAGPGAVLIAEGTRRLLGQLFELEAVAGLALPGMAEPVPAFAVTGDGRTVSRFEARRGAITAPMVGRDQELAHLVGHWRRAEAGQGQGVLLVGEAGIGKSRLLRGLRDAVAGAPHREVCWQCSSFHGDSPLWPVLQELVGNPAETITATLERRLAQSGTDPDRAVPLLAALLGVGVGERYPQPDLGPDAQRPRLLAVLLDHLLGLAAGEPLLIIVEDAHWADPTTLELTRLLLERVAAAPICVVIAARPENVPDLPHLTRRTLGRLDRAAVAAIVARLAPEQPATTTLLDTILRRTDGVPLFVEELTKALAEQSPGQADGPESAPDVPASLHDTLMARLDRLGDAKEIAQLAACIGREINHRLLAAISGRPEAQLRLGLDRLCDAELLFRQGTPPDARYSFKHALVRDVAYESLLKSRRRTIHARLLEAMERGVVAAGAEQTAHHAAAAEQWAKALHHYASAGKAALERAANVEGLGLVAKALDAGAHLAGDTSAEVAMIDLRRARGWAYLTMGETPRMFAELRESESRAARYGLTRLTCQLRSQRTHVESIFGASIWRAMRYGREALRLATSLRDADLEAAARFALGHACWVAGDYVAGVAELACDADTYRRGLRVAAIGSSGTLAVDGLAVLGDCLGQLGRWDEAVARGSEAQAVAAETGSPWDASVANAHLAHTHLARGDCDSALPLIERNLEFNRRAGLRMALPWQQALLGQVRLLTGRLDEAVELFDQAIDGCNEMRLQHTGTQALALKAEARLAAGHEEAGALASEVLAQAHARGYRAIEATALRLSAANALPGDHAAARRHLAAARAIAEPLGIVWELDALTRLAGRFA